jgi:hypothetical protein
MPPSRDDDIDQYIAALERDNHRLRCEVRRVHEALDWRDEQIRVLRRVIERLGASDDAD